MFPKASQTGVMGEGSRKGGLFLLVLKMGSVKSKSHSKQYSTAHVIPTGDGTSTYRGRTPVIQETSWM